MVKMLRFYSKCDNSIMYQHIVKFLNFRLTIDLKFLQSFILKWLHNIVRFLSSWFYKMLCSGCSLWGGKIWKKFQSAISACKAIIIPFCSRDILKFERIFHLVSLQHIQAVVLRFNFLGVAGDGLRPQGTSPFFSSPKNKKHLFPSRCFHTAFYVFFSWHS